MSNSSTPHHTYDAGEHTMNTHTSHTSHTTHAGTAKPHRRISRLIVGGGAAVVLAMAVNASVASSAAPSSGHVDLSGVAAWAVDNNVSGLSPASVHTTYGPVSDTSALTEWAIENGMTGLSPASLRPIGE